MIAYVGASLEFNKKIQHYKNYIYMGKVGGNANLSISLYSNTEYWCKGVHSHHMIRILML